MNLNLDFDWIGNPKATLNLLLNVAAAFGLAFLLSSTDPTLPWRARAGNASVTAAMVALAKLSKRPSDVAAVEKMKDGVNPGRRATDPPAGAPLPPEDPRTGQPKGDR
jgi:hypothetical protein